MHIVLKANRMLELFNRTCPLMTDIKVRRTLSISREVTAYLCHGSLVSCQCQFENNLRKSPDARHSLDTKNQNRRYVLQTTIADLLPLTYDGELRDLLFLYNYISGNTDLNIERYVTFITHGRSRSKNPDPRTKTATFQAWNLGTLSVISPLKTNFLAQVYSNIFCTPLISLYWTLPMILTCPAPGSSSVTALATALNSL